MPTPCRFVLRMGDKIMKRAAFLTPILALGAMFSATLSAQQAKPPELTVRANTDFLKLPDDVYFEEAVGVSLDSSGARFRDAKILHEHNGSQAYS